MHRVALLIDHVEQLFLDVGELPLARRDLAIGDHVELALLHELPIALLLQNLEEALVLRRAEVRLIQARSSSVSLALLQSALSLSYQAVDELGLLAREARDHPVVLRVVAIALIPDGTRDD